MGRLIRRERERTGDLAGQEAADRVYQECYRPGLGEDAQPCPAGIRLNGLEESHKGGAGIQRLRASGFASTRPG